MLRRRFERLAQLATVAFLVAGCFVVLRPFLAAMLFSASVCLATWPLYAWLRRCLGGRNAAAASLMTLLLVLAGLLPFVLVSRALVDSLPVVLEWVQGWFAGGVPKLPAWLTGLPIVGEPIEAYWERLAASREELLALLRRALEPARAFLLAVGAVLAEGVLQLAFAAFIGFFLYRDADVLVATLRGAAVRLAGEMAEPMLATVSATVTSVMHGIVGTAIAQAVVATIGFWIAGVPAALLLGAATFVLSVVPFGAPLVAVGAALWLFDADSPGWAMFMLGWGILIVGNIDNVIKPLVISRGAAMPFVLVLLGVLGGVLAFGFIGVFLGPTLLAVGYALTRQWIGFEPGLTARLGEPSVPP